MYFLPQVVCQKRKPQIDGWFLYVRHLPGWDNPLQWKSGSCRLLLLVISLVTPIYCWRGYNILFPQVVCKKKTLKKLLGFLGWLLKATAVKELPCILTTSSMPKTEAIN